MTHGSNAIAAGLAGHAEAACAQSACRSLFRTATLPCVLYLCYPAMLAAAMGGTTASHGAVQRAARAAFMQDVQERDAARGTAPARPGGQRAAADGQDSSPPRVVNDGIPGESSTELRARFLRELQRYKPQVVVIYAGMNDAANDKKLTSPEVFRSNMEAMLDQAAAAHVLPVMVAIQPVDEARVLQRHSREAYEGLLPNLRIRALNAQLEQMSAAHHVALVRFDRALADAGGPTERLSPDGVHLTAAGYAMLADAVGKQLRGLAAPQENVLCLGDSLTFGQGVRPHAGALADDAGTPYPTYPELLQEHLAAHSGHESP